VFWEVFGSPNAPLPEKHVVLPRQPHAVEKASANDAPQRNDEVRCGSLGCRIDPPGHVRTCRRPSIALDVQRPGRRAHQPLGRGRMISSAFRKSALGFAVVAVVLGLWSGAVIGITFGLLVFSVFIVVVTTLMFFSVVNDRINAKIARLHWELPARLRSRKWLEPGSFFIRPRYTFSGLRRGRM